MSLVATTWQDRRGPRRIYITHETENHVIGLPVDIRGMTLPGAKATRVRKTKTGVAGYTRVLKVGGQ